MRNTAIPHKAIHLVQKKKVEVQLAMKAKELIIYLLQLQLDDFHFQLSLISFHVRLIHSLSLNEVLGQIRNKYHSHPPPQKLTRNLKITLLEKKNIFQISMFRFHLSFSLGCITQTSTTKVSVQVPATISLLSRTSVLQLIWAPIHAKKKCHEWYSSFLMSKVWKFWEAFKLKIPRWFKPPWPLQLRGGHPTTPKQPSHFIEAKTHRARTTLENFEKPGRPTIFVFTLGWLVGWLLGCLVAWVAWLLGCLVGWLLGWLVGWLVGWFCKTQLLRLDSILEEIHLGELQKLKHFLGGKSRTKISEGWWNGLDGWTSVSCLSLSHVFLPLRFNSGPCNREAECSLTKTWQKTSLRRSYCMIHPACVSQHGKNRMITADRSRGHRAPAAIS